MTEKFVLGVDLDGVVADYEAAFRVCVAAQRGLDPASIPEQQLWSFADDPGWPISSLEEFSECHRRAVVEQRMFREMPMVPGASQALWRLSDAGVHIRVISSRLCVNFAHERAAADTVAWLEEHRIPYRDLCLVSTRTAKSDVEADAYVDDSPRVLADLVAAGRGTVFCMDRAYNRTSPGLRVTAWDQVADAVLAELEARRAA